MDRSGIPYDTCHQGVPSGASKLISKHMVFFIQTVHLPCIRISIISKLTKPSFHLSLFTQEYQIVRPKWFLSLCCIMCKPGTYLAPKLTLSRFGVLRDNISFGARYVHGLRLMHQSLRNHFGSACWYLGEEAKVEARFGLFRDSASLDAR